jgi:hypothetical protein
MTFFSREMKVREKEDSFAVLQMEPVRANEG